MNGQKKLTAPSLVRHPLGRLPILSTRCHVYVSYLAIHTAVVLILDATGLLLLLCRAFRFPGGRPRGRQGLPAPRRFRHHADLLGRPAEPPSSLPGGEEILLHP